jgi:GntR family transcriptional regulator, transcriptional repressor for pyruvate dehydrogenase complex
MTQRKSKSASALDLAVARLRSVVLSREVGALLGNEDELQNLLSVSRPTMRQAARVLEREGLLRVKRGNNGGYFGARPDPAFIEATLATYLETLDARPEDLTMIASVLWVEVVRRAASLPSGGAALASRFRGRLKGLGDDAGFSEVLALEDKIRRAIFALIKSPYVELIFNVNADFARRRLVEPPSARDATPEHMAFVQAWRKAKHMEVDAIADGDVDMAVLAAGRARNLIFQRVWQG